ncbi:MAG TPA: hypothetical protein VHK69_11240, partial [Chitinophagaceae bacterium]|nr:hypothetical protein [Chitinophagaceae bacterium]
MKKLLTASVLLLSVNSFGQIAGKKTKDTYMLFDSIAVYPGDTLHFGTGSDRRGDFVYLYQPANGWLGTAEQSVPRQYANKQAVIKHFKKQKDKRTGEKTVAVVAIGMLNCVADLEGAVKAEEIVAINNRSTKKEPVSTAPVVV